MIKIAALISDKGTGTNLQAIIDGIKFSKINGKIVVVVSDTKKAIGLSRAKKNNLQIAICPDKNQLKSILQKSQPDFVALAGWKQIVTDDVIETYPNKILNLHPGLIPDNIDGTAQNPDGTKALWNRGLLAEKAINNFLEKKATYAGSSVHFLSKEFDFGKVLARRFVKINKNDTVNSLYERLKKKEHQMYVEVLQKLSESKKATILIIDGGGRGSVLVDKYLQSTHVGKVLAIPGNDLMTLHKNVKIFPEFKTTDVREIIKICKKENVDLVDVAQDDAVAVGLVDALEKESITAFGPTKAAGQVEWDKAWARNFMKNCKLPQPAFKVCNSQKQGIGFIESQKENNSWYIKASGLAAGKGAIFAKNSKKAILAIKEMKKFGTAGKTFLIEECLFGEEFSSFAIVNDKNFQIIGQAQDHKKVYNGDLGPNTGGMGCSSPPMVISPKIESQIKSIFKITVEGLSKMGRPYVGILYLGGLIDNTGKVWVIEFNARWGDPEAQVIVPSIKNDLYELAIQTLQGKLPKINKDNLYRIVVTATSKGYPDDYSKIVGKEVNGLSSLIRHSEPFNSHSEQHEESQDKLESIKVFGAGVKVKNNKYIVSGGRLFYVLGQGKNVAIAQKEAYNALSQVSIKGNNLHFRTDIGYRDLQRLKDKRR